ncbi:polysaccharide deacetylase family protein [Paeniglutamicibacter sp. NPDC012692]|uniref:polysaccharide deacetylase family protein n=1 Tax=Paeniglutamicibacter sp. NPDC012692 TaxID=3364388 RepID=UPI003674F039
MALLWLHGAGSARLDHQTAVGIFLGGPVKRLSRMSRHSLSALGVLALCVGMIGGSGASEPHTVQGIVIPHQKPDTESSLVGQKTAAAVKTPAKMKTTVAPNLRKSARVESEALLTIPQAKVLSPLQRATNGWYKVKYKSRTGWVSHRYAVAPTKSRTISQKFNQNRGPNRTKRVVLTYDDCPLNLKGYKSVLGFAERSNIGLVIAPTGKCLKKFKKKYGVDIAAIARAKGQWVISHTATHPDMRALSCAAGAKELTGGGIATNVGRPPYGAINDNVRCAFKKAHMSIWTWTRSTRDWDVKSKKITISRAAAAGPGETVLMHMQWYGFTPNSIEQIRDRLGKKNVKLCRAYHGADGHGAVEKTPLDLPNSLPC